MSIGFASFSVGMILLPMTGCKGWLMNPGTTDQAMLSQVSGEKVDRSTTSSSELLPKGGVQHEQVLLKGSTVVLGTVTGIRGNQIEVEYEDSLQPRFLPLNHAKEKGMKIAVGDMVEMVFNEQDILVDFHPLGHLEGEHKVIRGVIHQQMPIGQERVVIKTSEGETMSFFVKPLARSKMASMPVGVDAVFLADETGKIVDVTYGSEDAVNQTSNEYQRMSNPKSAHTRIDGVLFDSFENDTITIETSGGKKWMYHVRPLLKDELSALKQGERLTLLIDSDHYVIDVATPKKLRK
jgi:hypothetical protein